MGRQRAGTYIGISSKRARGREEKSKSRDLSNRSLKTEGETESGNLHRDLFKKSEGKRRKEQDRQGDRERRTYVGINIRKTSLKTDEETKTGEPT